MVNDKVTLTHRENTKPQSLWRHDEIEAWVNEKKVGYIKIAYIAESTAQEFRQDPLLFAHHALSVYGLYHENWAPNASAEKILVPNYYHQARYIARLIYSSHQLEQDALLAIEKWNEDELKEYVKNTRPKVLQKMLKNDRARRFAEYHFCRPDIDFIRVEEAHQRQGIGTLLYRAASQWMNQRGLVLHSSSLQQEEAVQAWEKMKKNGEADVLQLPNHSPRYRYVKDVDPTWLSDKIVFKSPKWSSRLFKSKK